MNYIVWAIPVFFLFIALEFLASKVEGKKVYRLNDSINDLSCGVLQQIISAFAKTILLGVYVLIYEIFAKNSWHIFHISSSVWMWIVLFILVDFLYYWAHRFSHTTAIGWAGHAIHHQSEEFNLAVALRQGTLQPFFTFLFFLPLAIIGFPPAMYLITKAANTLYQFWIHTRLINTMGPFEWVMNTPSHHRVHHGKNQHYIDKNYAGVFIIWDRLFGSFQQEDIHPAYGVTTPLNSWNPIWANASYFLHLGKLSLKSPFLVDKIKVWFMPPGWNPRNMEEDPAPSPDTLYDKYDPKIPMGISIYAVLHFAVVILATMYLLGSMGDMQHEKYTIATLIILSLINIGGFFDTKKWAVYFEVVRLYAIAIFITFFYKIAFLSIAMFVVATLCSIWINYYYRILRENNAFS
ncbi:sterol desaturase family protein [Candidatus Uabimicrobium amorphum]|uniref:Sterol desaturase n=1 Tax=Uabimicrobium amorphum TaxID=2596890 RepID=A0A5S9IPH4_UABAM|nr:sterol desaturase family protein [Candidatus Uabimicrobium amorphum]BBM85698.1 sterol desaturase [Candidatus Uabimicrobium amorphum]